MSYHEPISIQATFTNTNGESVEKQFRSLNQAAKFFTLSVQTLKELSLGMTPKTHQPMPKDLKVTQIPTLPKSSKVPGLTTSKQTIIEGLWHCDICDRSIKSKSKYAHIMTAGHNKMKGILEAKQQQTTPNNTNELNKTILP